MTFQPEGFYPDLSVENLHLLHGTLPHEVVCTENLTPFLKMLPCKGKAGISSLLDGHKLFDAAWQTMAVDVRQVCLEGTWECSLEIEQTIDMVLDIERSKRPHKNPIPRPPKIEDIKCDSEKPYGSHGDSCYPLDRSPQSLWSLSEVFGKTIQGACSMVSSDALEAHSLCIRASPESEVSVTVSDGGLYPGQLYEENSLRCYQLPVGFEADLTLSAPTLRTSLFDEPRLLASRGFTGYGQEHGGLRLVLTNPSRRALDIVYLESLPWFLRPYLHTLGTTIHHLNDTNTTDQTEVESPIKETYYRPVLDRVRGTHLELLLSVPSQSILALTFDFEKAFLRYTEYPPDANRGFDVAPAIIKVLPQFSTSSQFSLSNQSRANEEYYLRTTSLLLSLPTPDFSMPYNVIILTSTVMALAFGSVFNLLVRRFVGADEVEALTLKEKLKARIRTFQARLRGKVAEKGE